MNDQQKPDLPRDEHLRAALRHAPDAGVGAPADLGVKIRAAALRAATVAAAPPSPSPVVPGMAAAAVVLAGASRIEWVPREHSPHC